MWNRVSKMFLSSWSNHCRFRSNDATLSIARQHNCNLMHINKKEFSFGKSLNIGCSHTISDYLVFISGHCVPVNGSWLERLIEPLRKGIVNYTYGKQMGGTETFWSEEKIFEKYFPDKSAIPQRVFIVIMRIAQLHIKHGKNLNLMRI